MYFKENKKKEFNLSKQVVKAFYTLFDVLGIL